MLSLSNVTFRYGDGKGDGIEGIDLTVGPGECVALVGRSGCGKSTILRCANGLAQGFYTGTLDGEVRLSGLDVATAGFPALATRVGTVFQDPRSQFFSADSLSELCFACENLALNRNEMRRRAEEAVASLGIDGLLSKSVLEMSGGERQLLAIASVRAARPVLYALDEPSANLDHEATRRLARALAALKAEGSAILVAEHRLWYLREVVDRVVVIEGGTVAGTYSAAEALAWSEPRLASLGLRRFFPERAILHQSTSANTPRTAAAKQLGDVGVEARELSVKVGGTRVLKGASIRLRRGTVTALVGANGAGESTLARALCGLARLKAGTVRIDGRGARRGELARSAYYLMQDCDYELFSDSVASEPILGTRRTEESRLKSEALLARLGLGGLADRHPATLSRGQKQRLCAACAAMRAPALLALDEPTSGLDAGSMAIVGALAQEWAKGGTAVLAITHDYEFAAVFADAVAVMEDGRVTEVYDLDDRGLTRLADHFFPATEARLRAEPPKLAAEAIV